MSEKTDLKIQELLRRFVDLTQSKFTGSIVIHWNCGGVTRIETIRIEELKTKK